MRRIFGKNIYRRGALTFFIFSFAIVGTKVLAKDWDPRLAEASRLAYEGKISQAQSVIDTYIHANPNDPNGLFVKAIVMDWKAAFQGEEYTPANMAMLEVYKKANTMAFYLWEKDPKNVDRLIDFGNSYLFLGRKESELGHWLKAVLTSKKSQKHLEEALERDPSRVDAYFAFGAFHYFADNAPPAAAAFRGLLGIKGTKQQGLAELQKAMVPTHPYYYDVKYVWYFIQADYEKNYPEALRTIDELEKAFPDNPELPRKRAQVAEKQDKAKGVQQYIEFAKWCEAKGDICNRNYRFLAAFDAGRLYKDLGQNAPAKEWLAKAAELDTKLDPSLSAKTLIMLGQMEQAEGKTGAAIEKFSEAKSISKLPKNLKKEIEKTLDEACKIQNVPEKC